MFRKLFKMMCSYSPNIWLEDSVVYGRLTKELR